MKGELLLGPCGFDRIIDLLARLRIVVAGIDGVVVVNRRQRLESNGATGRQRLRRGVVVDGDTPGAAGIVALSCRRSRTVLCVCLHGAGARHLVAGNPDGPSRASTTAYGIRRNETVHGQRARNLDADRAAGMMRRRYASRARKRRSDGVAVGRKVGRTVSLAADIDAWMGLDARPPGRAIPLNTVPLLVARVADAVGKDLAALLDCKRPGLNPDATRLLCCLVGTRMRDDAALGDHDFVRHETARPARLLQSRRLGRVADYKLAKTRRRHTKRNRDCARHLVRDVEHVARLRRETFCPARGIVDVAGRDARLPVERHGRVRPLVKDRRDVARNVRRQVDCG